MLFPIKYLEIAIPVASEIWKNPKPLASIPDSFPSSL